jgi:hypothetical protein
VYCSEVEAVLQRHPAIAQAAVFAVPSPVMGELAAAAVVPRPSAGAAAADGGRAAELIAWCRGRLAHYKVPSRVVLMEALPTTGSGKVLKRALREMLAVSSGPAAPAAPPAAGPLALASRAVAAAPPAGPPPSPPHGHAAVTLPLPRAGCVGGGSGAIGWDAQELAQRAAAALGAGAAVARAGEGPLEGGVCYALPLVAAAAGGLAMEEQVGAGLERGLVVLSLFKVCFWRSI